MNTPSDDGSGDALGAEEAGAGRVPRPGVQGPLFSAVVPSPHHVLVHHVPTALTHSWLPAHLPTPAGPATRVLSVCRAFAFTHHFILSSQPPCERNDPCFSGEENEK